MTNNNNNNKEAIAALKCPVCHFEYNEKMLKKRQTKIEHELKVIKKTTKLMQEQYEDAIKKTTKLMQEQYEDAIKLMIPKQLIEQRILEIHRTHQTLTPDGYWYGTLPIIIEARLQELEDILEKAKKG